MDVQDFFGPQVSIARHPIPLEFLQNTELYLALGFGVWDNTSVHFECRSYQVRECACVGG